MNNAGEIGFGLSFLLALGWWNCRYTSSSEKRSKDREIEAHRQAIDYIGSNDDKREAIIKRIESRIHELTKERREIEIGFGNRSKWKQSLLFQVIHGIDERGNATEANPVQQELWANQMKLDMIRSLEAALSLRKSMMKLEKKWASDREWTQ